MLELNRKSIKENKAQFEKLGCAVPKFDIDNMVRETAKRPYWLHIGVGNLFKAYHAMIAEKLLDAGAVKEGVIAVIPNDASLKDSIFTPHDNLFLHAVMKTDGTLRNTVCAAVAEVISANAKDSAAWKRLADVFCAPSLQLVSLSVTEKAYNMLDKNGAVVQDGFDAGLSAPSHLMQKLAVLLYERWKKGGAALALLSTDNFSHNGDRLKDAVELCAKEYEKRGFVENAFVKWLGSGAVSFPLSMIDKITPFPSPTVEKALQNGGFTGLAIKTNERGGSNAAFVNTEEAEYLVIEDNFPNGRPPLERAGVYLTDRETVDKVERMKVCTCLNPLHTALAIAGCLLGFKSIAAEMADSDLARFARKLGEDEGLPVVTNPGIIDPKSFLDEVLTKRLPNPSLPDTPQRIAQDTSQKVGIRFGETIKLYAADSALGAGRLKLIPLVIALWCRYLMGVDDEDETFIPSPDPMLESLMGNFVSLKLGDTPPAGMLKPILENERIFGVNLYTVGLGECIEGYFARLVEEAGAVRRVLHEAVA